MKKKNYKEIRINKAIDKALIALGGMLDIPTAKAIKYFLMNPEK